MTHNNNILQELKELESSLATISPSIVYRVPGDYFEGLASHVMARIKALEAADAAEELETLSPLLATVRREMPYQVPQGYFSGLDKKLIDGALQSEQTADEELEGLSPLLSGIKKEMPYSVPPGYFDNVAIPVHTRKKEARVVPFTSRKWFRYAAAAVVVGFVTISGILIFNNNSSTSDPQKLVKDVAATINEEDANNIIDISELLTEDAPTLVASAEVKELVNSLTDAEEQSFVNDTEVIQSDLTEDLLLN